MKPIAKTLFTVNSSYIYSKILLKQLPYLSEQDHFRKCQMRERGGLMKVLLYVWSGSFEGCHSSSVGYQHPQVPTILTVYPQYPHCKATNTHSVSIPSVLSRMSRTVCWGFARYVKSQQKFGFDGLAKLQSILSLFLHSTLTLKNKLTVLSFHRGQSGPSPHLENISYPWQ